MNSHFQSSDTTSTLIGAAADLSGWLGSRSWLPIQAIPPSSMMVSAGIAQTTISTAPEYSQSGRYVALRLPALNHQANTIVAMIVGMLPMAVGWGEGGEQNAPLGRAVIGGLVLATVATLIFVPVVYSVLRRTVPSESDDESVDLYGN